MVSQGLGTVGSLRTEQPGCPPAHVAPLLSGARMSQDYTSELLWFGLVCILSLCKMARVELCVYVCLITEVIVITKNKNYKKKIPNDHVVELITKVFVPLLPVVLRNCLALSLPKWFVVFLMS